MAEVVLHLADFEDVDALVLETLQVAVVELVTVADEEDRALDFLEAVEPVGELVGLEGEVAARGDDDAHAVLREELAEPCLEDGSVRRTFDDEDTIRAEDVAQADAELAEDVGQRVARFTDGADAVRALDEEHARRHRAARVDEDRGVGGDEDLVMLGPAQEVLGELALRAGVEVGFGLFEHEEGVPS